MKTVTINNLASNQQHIFKVRAVDIQGNVDPMPATFSWFVVQPPSNTTITSVIDGNGNHVSNGGSTPSSFITFTYKQLQAPIQ